MTVLYFAYGSNMLPARLTKRCPSARKVGIAVLRGYDLSFSKKSIDGSGKATIARSTEPNSSVYGVIFELDKSDQGALDEAEGPGYERRVVEAKSIHDDATVLATTYVATAEYVDESLVPYQWYLELVLRGGECANLPERQLAKIRSVKAVTDPLPDRGTRKEALRVLAESCSEE